MAERNDTETTSSKIEAAVPRTGGDDVMQEINDRIRDVLDQAPSDAAVDLQIHQSRGVYKGLLKICSSHRKFVGGYRASRIAEVIERVFAEVKDQIAEWKRERQLQS